MKITPLKMWVQNVLPVVYDDSLSYYEMVGKINEKTNEIINQVNENTDDIEALNYVIQELGDIDELKELLEQVEIIVNDLYTTDTPIMDSANGSAGVADHAARSDHSHPSDSSKADADLGITGALAGQYVRIKTVDSGVPTEFENYMPHEVPNGGTTGQALRKESNADYDADWGDVHEVPNGGTTGQALKKNSNTDYDADWGDVHEVPSGGTTGQALKKNSSTNYDASWSDTHEIPSGGNKDNILVKDSNNNYDVAWTSTPSQMGSLAHINTGSMADRLYNPGEYLVYNGQLYKVGSTAISQGQTLTPGGNISSVSVTSEIKTPKMLKDNYLQVSDTFFSVDVANTSDMLLITFNRYGRFASFFAPYYVLLSSTTGIQVSFGAETITIYGNSSQIKIVPSNADIHDVYISVVEIIT